MILAPPLDVMERRTRDESRSSGGVVVALATVVGGVASCAIGIASWLGDVSMLSAELAGNG